MSATPVYRQIALNFHTQYAEVRERARTELELLPGTPGTLTLRAISGQQYWYRRYKVLAGKEVEDFVCRETDQAARQATEEQMQAAQWMQAQVRQLRKLGMQVADKDAARLLVEFHNRRFFEGGVVLVGTLAFMSLLNELGVVAKAVRAQDLGLTRRSALAMVAPGPSLEAAQTALQELSAKLGLNELGARSTTAKTPGAEGLRIDSLGRVTLLDSIQPVAEVGWHAHRVPFCDYLLQASRAGAVLAGGHCVPANLPDPARFVWHKLYSSAQQQLDSVEAREDLQQAAVLAAVLGELEAGALEAAAAGAPGAVLEAACTRLPALKEMLVAHPVAVDALHAALQNA